MKERKQQMVSTQSDYKRAPRARNQINRQINERDEKNGIETET